MIASGRTPMNLFRASWIATAVCLSLALFGCRGNAQGDRESKQERASAPAVPPAASAPAPAGTRAAARPRIVALGDSLTAGLGLPSTQAYPALLQQKLDANGYAYEVINAGVSGDTSAGGLRRLDWSLEGDVRVLIVALGANDGLRGLPAKELKSNLERIITRAKDRGIGVILAGMEAPPNYGREYTAAFRGVYTDLAREHDLPFLPFLLDKVAGVTSLNQADGIHPNAQGAAIVADALWRILQPMLERTAPAS
jgi:acyl-CoA thioesterase-1